MANLTQPPIQEPFMVNGTMSQVWINYFVEIARFGSTGSAETALNTAHRLGDGSDHSDVALNNTHRLGDGSDHSNVVLNNAHRVSDGSDHSFINQDVKTTASPNFNGLTLSGSSTHPVSVKIADYTLTSSDYCVVVNANSAAVTIQAPVSPSSGIVYKISVRDSTNTVLFDPNGNTFDGDAGTFELFEDESLEIIYDGTEWRSGG